MARWLHHVRKGEADADRRDLQVNSSARALGPWQGTHASFVAPELTDEPDQLDAYTGFAADGVWYEHGRRVTGGPGEKLGNAAHDFNSLKWNASGVMPWTQTAAGLVVAAVVGTASTFSVASRFELRGDFHVRLKIASSFMLPGADDEAGRDNAIWFGVRAVTGGATYLVKHTKNATGDNTAGFAAEVSGEGNMAGFMPYAVADGSAFDLLVRRVDGTLHLQVYVDGEVYEVWSGTYAGRVTLEWGARNTTEESEIAAGWLATFDEYVHVDGWHDYSALASWATERTRGALFEDFAGHELDARLWTEATTSNSTVECGGVANGRGLRLHVNDGGMAAAQFVTITGDWTARFQVRVVRAAAWVQGYGQQATLFGLDVNPTSIDKLPVVQILVESEVNSGAGLAPDTTTVRPRVYHDDGQGGGPTEVAEGDITDHDDPHLAFVIERRGRFLIVNVYDEMTGARLLNYTTDAGALPTVPLALRLWAAGEETAAEWTADIPSLQITSPHALRTDTWPGDYYGGGALAGTTEVSRFPGKVAYPTEGQLTLIGLVARSPFWRIVGGRSNEVGQGLQALPGGTVGDVWPDPVHGRLVIPVGGASAAFVTVDLRNDRIFQQYKSAGYPRIADFDGPVGWRHLGLGYTERSAFDGVDSPRGGAGLGYAEVPAGGDVEGDLHVWTEGTSVRVVSPALGTFVSLVDNGGGDASHTIHRSIVLPPPTGHPEKGATLVVILRMQFSVAVVVYRDLTAALAAGPIEASPGALADAIYSGTDLDAGNPALASWTAGKVIGPAEVDKDDTFDVHAVRPSTAGADDLPLIAVGRGLHGASIVQDDATPADALYNEWESTQITQSISEGDPPPPVDSHLKLTAGAAAVRLTPDACSIVGHRAGWLAVSCASQDIFGTPPWVFTLNRGGIDLIPLTTMKVRTRLALTGSAAEETLRAEFLGTDPRASARGLALAFPPPGMVAGLRVYVGLLAASTGVLEYDELAIMGGPWRGPHIGGTRFALQGFGLDGVTDVFVGGVDCFRLALDVRPEIPVLYAVNRALAFIEHPETGPAMFDEELAATPEWPKDILLRWRDGMELTIPGGFIYESKLPIEHNLARLLSRLPPSVIDIDPKADWPQRHILVAFAFLLVRTSEQFYAPLERDTFVETAEGEGLRHLAGSYGASPAYGGMSDDQIRAWVQRRVGGNRVTPKAILDLLETVLGVRPTMTESYREFTIHVTNLPGQPNATDTNFWSDLDDADPLSGAYFDRDFWGGDDPRIVAGRRLLNFFRAAGVRANLVLEDEAP